MCTADSAEKNSLGTTTGLDSFQRTAKRSRGVRNRLYTPFTIFGLDADCASNEIALGQPLSVTGRSAAGTTPKSMLFQPSFSIILA